MSQPPPSDEAKKRILARRARFMTAAITSAGLTATSVFALAQEGCGGDVEQGPQTSSDSGSDTRPSVCLEPAFDAGSDDTGPSACLRVAPDVGADTEPSACLSAPFDSGGAEDTSAPADASDAKDSAFVPCLAPPQDTGGS